MLSTISIGLAAAVLAPKSMEITIYNQNFALVKEIRVLDLRQGRQEVQVEDVAAQIDPTSVSFKSMTSGMPVSVLEQNYQYDLLTTDSILQKSVGKRVRLKQTLQNGQSITTEGVMLAAPGGTQTQGGGSTQYFYSGMVIKTDDGRIILSPEGTIEVMEIPEGLISRPTLMWDLMTEKAGKRDIELAYLTNSINWSADYVLTLNSEDTTADLNGWVTINNRSGATFNNATLKLIAGDVRRLSQPAPMAGFGGGREMMDAAKSAAGFAEQSLFEYHLYTLGRPATVRNNETKQIGLLNGADIPVNKELILEGQQSVWRGYGNSYRPGEGYATDSKLKVNVVVELHNTDKNGLGMPMPKGKVRVYKRDSSGQVQMLGEDEIDHTPREEKIRLYIGDSFDVVCERKRLSFKRVSSNVVQETFEIKVRNRKKTNENVRVVEHAWADWTILSESMKSKKTDSNTFEYVVSLKPDEERVITYTVQTTWL